MNDHYWELAGILITLIVGIPAYFAAKRVRTNRQSQKLGAGSTGYQAGRDIKIDQKP